MAPHLLTLKEAAKILNIHPIELRTLVVAGEFPGAFQYVGPRSRGLKPGPWRIPEPALDEFITNQQEAHERRARNAA